MEIVLGLVLLGISMWFFLKLMDKFDDKKADCQNCPYRKKEIPLNDFKFEWETKSITKR